MPLVSTWENSLTDTEDEQLRQRIAKATPKQTIRGFFFHSLLQAIRENDHSPNAVADALEAAGLKGQRWTIMANYPISDYNKLRLVVCDKLAKKHPIAYADAAMQLAKYATEGFFRTLPGRTMKIVSSRQPHRLMAAAPRGYDAIINDGGFRTYQPTSERAGVFTFVGDTIGPAHQAGVFLTAHKIICKVDPNLRVVQNNLTDFKLYLEW